ncbi:unnamed protein product, partial [Musa acuminata var. zebrina]
MISSLVLSLPASPIVFGSPSSAGIWYLHTGQDPCIPSHFSMHPPWNRCLHGISLTDGGTAPSSEAAPLPPPSPSRHTGHSSPASSSPGSTVLNASIEALEAGGGPPPPAAGSGEISSESSAGSPWRMTTPRVSGLSMTTRSSPGAAPSAAGAPTTAKTTGKKPISRRSSPPALRRSSSKRASTLSASASASASADIDRDRREGRRTGERKQGGFDM